MSTANDSLFVNASAEKAVLGAALLDADAAKHIARLPADIMRDAANALVFDIIKALQAAGQRVDVVTVSAELDKRNLEAYARFCMDMVKEQLNEENELSVAKCTTKEFQSMKKAERKIDEIESAAKSGNAIASSEEELRLAWRTVSEMKQKIEEIRSLVMSTGGRRIVYESQPEISWVIRRKTCK